MKLMKIKFLNESNHILKVFFLFVSLSIYSQNKNTFDSNLNNSLNFNLDKFKEMSKSNNAYNFMTLGYFINANNNMYLKSGDILYLYNNLEIIKPILIDSSSVNNYNKNKWKMNVSKNNQNAIVNGREHLISEGYFFRYIGEFLDIISENNIFIQYQSSICSGLINSFSKWKDKSFKQYGDYSLLFHQRLHIGANWAIVALYLNKFDSKNSKDYMTFINIFDNQLEKALQLKEENGQKFYVWSSSYPEKFCKALKNIKNYSTLIQDVSHGNHVVLYLLKSKELKNRNWTEFNFSYLINTLKIKILKPHNISDNVDGTFENNGKSTGWKISDGWYKLIYMDKSLYPIFQNSLKIHQNNIKNSFLESQFNSIYL
ncbi:hypothetical protein [Myroides guanonis]|uniref:D-glucuronyl C5-epimerase C-terminal domain-containing protein n=1 Tax=Myroides guanonis TaxID=1150112 RepID=A0A1I3L455_9FLAO|nr:hypothetical protein [Myroides guanonis]SFI79467.1 hypothetical protein SAMN04487893_101168 [Myroides guanonis]